MNPATPLAVLLLCPLGDGQSGARLVDEIRQAGLSFQEQAWNAGPWKIVQLETVLALQGATHISLNQDELVIGPDSELTIRSSRKDPVDLNVRVTSDSYELVYYNGVDLQQQFFGYLGSVDEAGRAILARACDVQGDDGAAQIIEGAIAEVEDCFSEACLKEFLNVTEAAVATADDRSACRLALRLMRKARWVNSHSERYPAVPLHDVYVYSTPGRVTYIIPDRRGRGDSDMFTYKIFRFKPGGVITGSGQLYFYQRTEDGSAPAARLVRQILP